MDDQVGGVLLLDRRVRRMCLKCVNESDFSNVKMQYMKFDTASGRQVWVMNTCLNVLNDHLQVPETTKNIRKDEM